ncbi:MAG: hypothetical protein JXR59_10720 [Desulfuromonadaceae bacterium]|nr:hypothetical protein [Desulfuromonadaceae bacterium]
MNQTHDVIEVAWKAGEFVWTKAHGNPAMLVAGAVVAGVTLVGYGGYACGEKIYRSFSGEG